MSLFFLNRPVFAWVIAIGIMVIGLLSINNLPIQQYPTVAPPVVSISATYPGASAPTVENSVTQIIEQSLTGIDNMRYFSASSSNSASNIMVTFEPGTNPDIAQVQVQNKVQTALPFLPASVQQQGIIVNKGNDTFLMVVGFYSENDSVSQNELSDLLVTNIQDQLARVEGVGSVSVFGSEAAMRIWLNPDQLNQFDITPMEVYAAIQAQNVDISAGQIGGLPAVEGQQINAAILAQSKLQSTEDFENIQLKTLSNGAQVKLGDVARVELGAENYDAISRYKRHPATGIAITLATGANALATADAVKSRMTELQATLPDSVNVIYPFETTPFIELSIKSVVKTLIEAVLLVFLVMYLFLQSFRATLVPTIMVPIVVLGTFGILSILGFTINTLTMFAMVLAIGLLVDDAIVVVENVERVMEEEGLSAFEASKQSIQQISGALIGIAMVLAAVFVPMAFFPGSAGKIYQQFSAAIVSAMVLSVILALILAPTLCAVLLKPKKEDHQPNAFFRWFNRVFDTGRDAYKGSVGFVASRSIWALLLYFILLALLAFKFMNLPTSFLPQEDQGNMFLILSAPPGSSAEVTMETIKKVEDHFLENEKETVEHLFTVVGFSFIGNSQNAGLGFVGLKDWDKRTGDGQDAQSIANRAMGAFSQFKEAMVFAITPPPINELGNSSGFDMQLIDLDREGHKALMAARNQLLGMASQNPSLVGVRPNGLEDEPQYQIDIDQNKAQALGLSLSDINDTLRIAWGSSYVNDFNDKGRIKAVYIQADAPYRMNADDLDLWYVRNSSGEMIPFSSFASGYWTYGSPKLERFNGYSSVNVQGSAAPGLSSGDAMDAMQELVKQLPGNYGLQWTGLSYEEQQSGDFSFALYALTVLVVFLSLAALYESWSIPFVVILAVPVGIIGAVIAAGLFDKANDIYFQVAILTAIGISAKNAILIVEFAKEHVENEGKSPLEATLEAASQRFRPIIMTSLAFMLGVTPLALASGAGSGAQNAIGLTVIGGMLTATFLAIFFVPLFFLLIMRLRKPKDKEPEHSSETEHTHV